MSSTSSSEISSVFFAVVKAIHLSSRGTRRYVFLLFLPAINANKPIQWMGAGMGPQFSGTAGVLALITGCSWNRDESSRDG
jgi:hypothetical protein